MTKHVDVTYDIAKRKVLTIHEVSEYLRVSRQTIYRMLRRGDIPGFSHRRRLAVQHRGSRALG
jgi:excisionase family DNA binding protein